MARIVVTSAAYLGDVAPFVEPANRLADRGHDVTFLAPRGFHPMLEGERFALATYPLDFSASGMHDDPVHERLMRHPFANTAGLARYWMRKGFVDDPDAGRACLQAALDSADAVVSHPTFGSAVAPVAASLGVPLVVGQLFPMMIPTTGRLPPAFVHVGSLGPRLNRLVWEAFARGSGAVMYDRALNRHRARWASRTCGGTASGGGWAPPAPSSS